MLYIDTDTGLTDFSSSKSWLCNYVKTDVTAESIACDVRLCWRLLTKLGFDHFLQKCIRKYFKVAEHNFSVRSCWCNLARAQGFQKTNMPSTERSFYLLKTRTICVIFLYNCRQCIDGFSILLQRYVVKGNNAKNPAIFSFCYRKNPVKCNACAVAQKIETDCF